MAVNVSVFNKKKFPQNVNIYNVLIKRTIRKKRKLICNKALSINEYLFPFAWHNISTSN